MHRLLAVYQQLLTLQDSIEEALARKDLGAVFSCERQVASLVGEIQALLPYSRTILASAQDTASMENLIRRILERIDRNQTGASQWLAETGTALRKLQHGAAAVRTYAAEASSGALILEGDA